MKITITFFVFMVIHVLSWGQTHDVIFQPLNNKSTYQGTFSFDYGSENYQIEFQTTQNVFTITKNGEFNCSGEFVKVGDTVFQLTPTSTQQDAILLSVVRFKTESIIENEYTVVLQEQNSELTRSITLMKNH